MGNPQKEFDRLGPWVTRFWVDGRPCGGNSYDPTNDGRIALFESKVGPLRGKRVLELGALEGGHTLQLARKGATVVAVEGRPANYQRCLFVKDFFQLEKVEFLLADLRTVDFRSLGCFDVIFNVGVLYHLNEPWRLLKSLRNVAPRMFIWTHCAPSDKIDAAVEVNGCRLEGLRWQEGPLKVPLSGLQPTSFWPTRESLEKMLALSGWPNLTWLDYNPQSPNGPSATLWVEQSLRLWEQKTTDQRETAETRYHSWGLR